AFELDDGRIQRAVLVTRRAEPAQPGMRLGLDPFRYRRRQPRLAEARLARDPHHAAFAGLGLLPAAQQKLQLLVTPDHRRRPRAQGLEAADFAALAENAPCL